VTGLPAILSTVVVLSIVGFVAEINVGQIVGSVASARAGAKQSWSFLAGTIASRLVQALVGAGFATAVADQLLGALKLGRLAYGLVALAGLAIVLEGIRLWIKRRRDDAPSAKDTEVTKRLGVRSAFASGFLINIVYLPNWIYVSVAVTNIAVLKAGRAASTGLFLVFLASSTWIGLWLSLLRVARPGRASAVIDGVGDWTDAHAPLILIVLVVAVGAAMLVIGSMGALGMPLSL
jgi:hypothetical protein